jgi:hypothetical protein
MLSVCRRQSKGAAPNGHASTNLWAAAAQTVVDGIENFRTIEHRLRPHHPAHTARGSISSALRKAGLKHAVMLDQETFDWTAYEPTKANR